MPELQRPWTPVEAFDNGKDVSVSVWGRTYTHQHAALPTSVVSQGRELLAGPVRLEGMANGEPVVWEEGCYLLDADEGSARVNGYAQSNCLILDTLFETEYDGGVRWDLRIMPRGMTVPQVFGIEPCPIAGWDLESLSLRIPLKKESCSLYNTWRDNWNGSMNGVRAMRDGAPLPENGSIPAGGIYMPFQASLLLGDEKTGLNLTSESDEHWQANDPSRMIEILDEGDRWVLVLHLLDHRPAEWARPGVDSPSLLYSFGLMATPVKPFNQDYLKWNAVHIDCFSKIEGDYWPFLNGPVSSENSERVIDRLSRAGVNLLILHEKWNTIQTNWNVPVRRAEEIRQLVKLCHARGIRVIPYFGYEITSSMPEYNDIRDTAAVDHPEQEHPSQWYRIPWQRCTQVCYKSFWADRFVEGVLGCVDRFRFDGVYLDGTTRPFSCSNGRHGCGYTDSDGKRHCTYPIFAVRELIRRISAGIHVRGGIVNPHPGGATIPLITAPVDMLWDGEHLQTRIRDEGLGNFSLDYFRAEYLGTDQGIPVQFIVYEFPGIWDFDKALSLCMIHGIYPRPNSVLHPLDVMERIWKITGTFGIADAEFHGYWENHPGLKPDSAQCRVSFYTRPQVDGTIRVLAIAANPSNDPADDLCLTVHPEAFGKKRIISACDARSAASLPAGQSCFSLPLSAYDYTILEFVLGS